MVQITKVGIEGDRIVLEINHGMSGGKKWYQNIQVGLGGSTQPISQGGDSNAPNGTTVARSSKANAATFGAVEKNTVTGVGAPS